MSFCLACARASINVFFFLDPINIQIVVGACILVSQSNGKLSSQDFIFKLSNFFFWGGSNYVNIL
jgi:hypothetical protein